METDLLELPETEATSASNEDEANATATANEASNVASVVAEAFGDDEAVAAAIHNIDATLEPSGGLLEQPPSIENDANHQEASLKRKRDAESTTTATATATPNSTTVSPSKRPATSPRKTSNRKEAKAPKPPRTAFELYALKYKRTVAASKKNKSNTASNSNNKTKPAIPTMAKIRAAFDKLGFVEQQQWKIQQAEDLLRYETQLATYAALEAAQAEAHAKETATFANNNNNNNTALKAETNTELAELQLPTNYKSNKKSFHAAAAVASNSHWKLSMARSSFNDFVFELLRFKAEKGHCRVPVKKGGVLGKWVDRIRKEYKRLKPIQRNRNSSNNNSNSDSNNSNEPIDVVVGDEALYFTNAYGRSAENDTTTTVVTRDPEALPDNIKLDCYHPHLDDSNSSKQSSQNESSHSTRFDRIKALSVLGMVWEFPNEDYEEIWQKHFQDLLVFKSQHGHCNVPQKGHGRLSWWVKIQRELYVNTKGNRPSSNTKKNARPRQIMPQHRITQLESVGFEWRIRPPALKWEERYKELLDYKKQFGDCNVPQNFPPNRVLGKWVMKQRGYYYDKVRGKKSPLNPNRQSKLEEIGFCWVAPHVAKTKAKLPLREDIIKEQLRARDAVAAATATTIDNRGETLPDAKPSVVATATAAPSRPPQPPLPEQAPMAQHPAPMAQHPPTGTLHEYNYHPYPHTHQEGVSIPYHFAATNAPGLHHDPHAHAHAHAHHNALGGLEGNLLNHIAATEHYLPRTLEHEGGAYPTDQQAPATTALFPTAGAAFFAAADASGNSGAANPQPQQAQQPPQAQPEPQDESYYGLH